MSKTPEVYYKAGYEVFLWIFCKPCARLIRCENLYWVWCRCVDCDHSWRFARRANLQSLPLDNTVYREKSLFNFPKHPSPKKQCRNIWSQVGWIKIDIALGWKGKEKLLFVLFVKTFDRVCMFTSRIQQPVNKGCLVSPANFDSLLSSPHLSKFSLCLCVVVCVYVFTTWPQ